MKSIEENHAAKQSREEILESVVPQFEKFIESRESYIQALEKTLKAVVGEHQHIVNQQGDIKTSIDELVAMQRLSNIIGTAQEPNSIIKTLIELTEQVIPVIEASIFLFDSTTRRLVPLTAHGSAELEREAQQHLEAGIVDWIFSEKKTVIIPDLSHLMKNGATKNYVMVPLMLRGQGIGVYMIHTEKKQEEFSHQDIQLLTVLANQAAVGVENWRTQMQLVKANNELKSYQSQMLQVAKLVALGELAASIVHEIKNPIQILSMQIEIIMMGKGGEDALPMLQKQIQRLAEITRRLMNFSRGFSEESLQDIVDVNRELKFIGDIIEHDLQTKRITVEYALSEKLPGIQGSAQQLQQVFLNLLINARDAMPEGGALRLATEVKDFQLQIHISDTGVGIAEENMTQLFAPFFTTKEEGKGTGLGLSICKKIITNHRGEIKVTSELGKGTTFTIYLPLQRTMKKA
ncbi:MAG: GAF domain-containing protein [Bacteroidetes bacterium]|nr:GAF domain-containing protein [Bacteroidota bacterium]